MNIRFLRHKGLLLLKYYPDDNIHWVIDKLLEDSTIVLKRTFSFEISDVYDDEIRRMLEEAVDIGIADDDDLYDHDAIEFILGTLDNDYYLLTKGIITQNHNIYLHKDIDINQKLFISEKNISILSKLENYTQSDVYIGGAYENSIPESVMSDLIAKFPNNYEKRLYEDAVISGIIRDYVDGVTDYKTKYEKFVNKRRKAKPSDLPSIVREQELMKFQLILDKLQAMLKDQKSYSELQWQEEILTIITLLYPKYISAHKSVPVKRKDQSTLQIDILLIDSGGYVDIIEIKKPSDNNIVTRSTYRDNYIPYRELSGTIMQIEKYIYYLNRWGADGEKYLSNRLTNLPPRFEVKLTNPGGLLILGRDNTLTKEQLKDFEVIKRKYKNIVDILTYDELIRRLKFTIELWSTNTSIND